MPKYAEFSSAKVPLSEIDSFLGVTGSAVPEDRPYTWSNTVATVDGIIQFMDDSSIPGDIALRHVPEASDAAAADQRLLAAGWMYADAVLTSAAILRAEGGRPFVVSEPDLLHNRATLRRKHAQPIQAVLSRHCNVDFNLPLFQREDVNVVVLTTKEGGRQGVERARRSFGGCLPARLSFAEFDDGPMGVDLRGVFKYLRKELDVKYLDVSCGGVVIRQLIDSKLLDELRYTMSGAFVGPFDLAGLSRPRHFAEGECHRRYSKGNCPLIKWTNIRTLGDYHIFFRGNWMYRH